MKKKDNAAKGAGARQASEGLVQAIQGIVKMLKAEDIPVNNAIVVGNLALLGNTILNAMSEED